MADELTGRNLAVFEAYVEYCLSPKHTVGKQLLDVRRDKRERAARSRRRQGMGLAEPKTAVAEGA